MNDLLFTQGQDNLAGIIGEIYLVPVEDVDTIPALTAASSLVTAGNIVLDAGKAWSRLYFTDETGKLDLKVVGERDGKGIEAMLSVRYPKLSTALFNWVRSIQNTPCLVAYKMANSGKWYIMGLTQFDVTNTELTADIPVYFDNAEISTGEKRPDQNGALLSWKFTSIHGPVEYNGTFDLTV